MLKESLIVYNPGHKLLSNVLIYIHIIEIHTNKEANSYKLKFRKCGINVHRKWEAERVVRGVCGLL